MAGTLPHAVFVETGVGPDGALAAAYAAELPGCAVFAASADEAAGGIPRRAAEFTGWLRERGETAPTFVGDNWYEVERATAEPGRRAAFSLDDLAPSAAEMAAWMRWLELAREELAAALDIDADAPQPPLAAIVAQDRAFCAELGAAPGDPDDDPLDSLDALYAARDALTDALVAAGAGASGVRRILRVAIADDLRLADELRARA